jgi:hypothetical protein
MARRQVPIDWLQLKAAFETHLDGSAASLDLRTGEVHLIKRSSFGDAALGDQEEVLSGDACRVHLLVQGLSGVILGEGVSGIRADYCPLPAGGLGGAATAGGGLTM